ncbi:hypothetical protein RB614_12730 [Phytohabitans sp. ZYX-F-186]|uniref:Uncharacterized protein n=1 Tax=Phytohabitans maris TaxID=3071409 RepID=A0ABU0ZGI4_9ACTN|nr:hypothetical protein [Phytohabitans sp. ZYX-F-186]MDQ7905390.1 hypothetical protein [Phytohabitans sp. ZYX-F-186]
MLIKLPAPDVLASRWGALAAAMTAAGYDDVYWFDADGAHYDDHGGNWARLILVEGGRAVLFGFDHEYSDTTTADPPIDLLAGAPAWLPWPRLLPHADEDMLGAVYWYEGGSWHRVGYPDGLHDGLRSTIGWLFEDGAAIVAELRSVVSEWGGHDIDGEREAAEVTAAADRLVAAATARTVDAAALEGLLGRLRERPVDLAAGVAMAARAGLTAGSTAPVTPAATEAPQRRVRLLSDREHNRLVWTAMRESGEFDRPTPGESAELAALVAWTRGRAPGHDGRCTLLFEVLDTSARQVPGEVPPGERPGDDNWTAFHEATELVRRLREAEAHPERGHWIYLRLATTATGYEVERRYDSWPPWIPDDGISGPWLDHLRQELGRRAPGYRPHWTTLLAPEVVYTGSPASR